MDNQQMNTESKLAKDKYNYFTVTLPSSVIKDVLDENNETYFYFHHFTFSFAQISESNDYTLICGAYDKQNNIIGESFKLSPVTGTNRPFENHQRGILTLSKSRMNDLNISGSKTLYLIPKKTKIAEGEVHYVSYELSYNAKEAAISKYPMDPSPPA